MPSSASSRTKKTETASTLLEVVGSLVLAGGFALANVAVGIVVLGVELIVFGLALSLGSAPDADGA